MSVVGSLVVGVGGGCVFRFSFLMVHALERWKVLVLVKRVLQLTKCYPINLQTFTYHEYGTPYIPDTFRFQNRSHVLL